jgi:hypothetical protein
MASVTLPDIDSPILQQGSALAEALLRKPTPKFGKILAEATLTRRGGSRCRHRDGGD